MATVAADSEEKPNENSFNENKNKNKNINIISNNNSNSMIEETPWIAYAAQQAQLFQNNLEQSFDSALITAKSRFSQIRSTSSAHFNQTLSLEEVKAEYKAYEDVFFGKVKEGIVIAASNPMITVGAALGLGIVVFKRPRRLITSSVSRLLVSEETLISRADAKVKDLRQSINFVKSESEKLEKQALQAEEELKRGKTKLRHAGKQIQDVIRSASKIERQAKGLKDIVGELPSGEASRFRKQVSDLASEAKQERNVLTKEVSKIINYGISI
ncbi:hypothetical protein AQUCO_01300752v1 [Aquilegia coerulea]|uniref:Uncharacterized protein n=1 Tax=Aquilegia coerulea TaxID=218851 RepID=A0A2G5E399_AQUCA|nr:hypothetical protein AQUCO_01300752v1 [Aquilegia coerulea]